LSLKTCKRFEFKRFENGFGKEKEKKKEKKTTNNSTQPRGPAPLSAHAGPSTPPLSPSSLPLTDGRGPPVSPVFYIRPRPFPAPAAGFPRRLPFPAAPRPSASSTTPSRRRRTYPPPSPPFPLPVTARTEPPAAAINGRPASSHSHRLPGIPPPRLYL
jgi:hypothetical protein